jgi:hypothetical protein
MSAIPPKGYSLPPLEGPGMPSFVRGDFDREVQDNGLKTVWEQRYPCPCRSSDHNSPTEQTDSLCLQCYGTGDAYHSPVLIRVVYDQPKMTHNELVVWGDYLGGEAIATPRSEFILGHRDRLTVLDSLFIAEDLKERPDVGELLELRHPIASREAIFQQDGLNPCVPEAALSDDPDNPCSSSMFGRHIFNQRVMFLGYHANTRQVPSGTDHDVVTLQDGIDFGVTSDGKIDLSLGDQNGHAPEPGTRLSVVYLAHPVWIVAQYAPYASQFVYQTEQVEEPELIELPKSMKCELRIFDRRPTLFHDVRDLGGF